MLAPHLTSVAWHKSSYSGQGGDCVEVAALPGLAAVRDSKEPDGPALLFTAEAWAAFLAEVKGTCPPSP
jgi:hypothetical protein